MSRDPYEHRFAERICAEAFPANDHEHLTYARACAVHNPLGGLDAAGGIGVVGASSVEAPQPSIVPCPAYLTSFVDRLLASASRALDLVRLSLTVPREREADLVRRMHEFAEWVANAGEGHGAWLLRDLRKKTFAPHVYGLVLVDAATRASLVKRWCAMTGADPDAHRGTRVLTTVSGWPSYAATGDGRSLRTNLLRPEGTGYGAITYGVKPLPNGEHRDLDGDHVAVTGALRDPWRASRATVAGKGAAQAPAGLAPMGAAVPIGRRCDVCDADISGKRVGAKTCSARCRMKKRDRRSSTRPARQPTRPPPKPSAKPSTAGDLLSLVRELVRGYPETVFSSADAHAAGANLGVAAAEVDRLLLELVEDGVALVGHSGAVFALLRGRRAS